MNLKAYLVTINMSLKDFAEYVGCSVTYLSRLVHGHFQPSDRLAKMIQDATGGEVKWDEISYKKKSKPVKSPTRKNTQK